jgi:phage gp37-like protein
MRAMSRRSIPAAFALIVLVASQLAAFAHESTTRHVTCAEHGEQLEAAVLVGIQQHRCHDQHLVAVEGHGGSHDECVIARVLHQSATAHVAQHAITALTTHASAQPLAISVPTTVARYLIAPKTSPPAALHV